MANRSEPVPAFVLTGGPCAGKTSVLSYLQQELPEHGVRVVTVPETARMLLGGVNPLLTEPRRFQDAIITLQLQHEDAYRALVEAMRSERAVMLCDRGTMDSQAYVSPDLWRALLAEKGWNAVDLRDRRYHAVIHLLTAAEGAEEFYVNDAQRRETAEEARMLDARTQRAWVGHPHLRIIDNSTDFEGKKRRALGAILHELGMPIPLEIERKYRIREPWPEGLADFAEAVEIEQAYVGEERIRKRGQGPDAIFYRAVKRQLRPGVREEREWQITPLEYYDLLRGVDPKSVIRKRRWCFVHRHQYFELDCFIAPREPYSLLEIELTEEQASIELPEWVTEAEDVTDDPYYSNREIALRALK